MFLTRRSKSNILRRLRRLIRRPNVRESDKEILREGLANMRNADWYPDDWGTPQNPEYRFEHLSEAPIG